MTPDELDPTDPKWIDAARALGDLLDRVDDRLDREAAAQTAS